MLIITCERDKLSTSYHLSEIGTNNSIFRARKESPVRTKWQSHPENRNKANEVYGTLILLHRYT